jgi:hypothetical protein
MSNLSEGIAGSAVSNPPFSKGKLNERGRKASMSRPFR